MEEQAEERKRVPNRRKTITGDVGRGSGFPAPHSAGKGGRWCLALAWECLPPAIPNGRRAGLSLPRAPIPAGVLAAPGMTASLEGVFPSCSPPSSHGSLARAKRPLEAGSATLDLFPPRGCLRRKSGSAARNLQPSSPCHGHLFLTPLAFLGQVLRDWQHQARSDWRLQAQSGNSQSGGQDC